MKNAFSLFLLFVLTTNPLLAADDWGRTGHRVTGEIAEKYLTKEVKEKIKELLNGASLAFVSTYGDEIKSDDRYRKYGPWHYVNFPFGGSYEAVEKSGRGDLIQGIQYCMDVIKDENASQKDKSFFLRMLVHFIGDLHMPLHVGIADDKGGNDFQVRWFGDGTNLHTVWDTKLIESYEMTFTELAENADYLSVNEIETIQNSTPMDWMYESRGLCEDIYANTEVGEKLGYKYMYRYVNVARSQMQKGGIRLAGLLNELFK